MELYKVLNAQIDYIKLENIDTNELQNSINNIDINGQKIIYVLIKYDYTLKNDPNAIPYKAKILKDGRIKIDMNEFPEKLIKILWLFMKKHSEKLDDEKNRTIIQNNTSGVTPVFPSRGPEGNPTK